MACESEDEPTAQDATGLDNPITLIFDTDIFGSCDNTVTLQNIDMTISSYPGAQCFYEIASFRGEFDGLVLAPAQIVVDFSELNDPSKVSVSIVDACGTSCTFVQVFKDGEEVFKQTVSATSQLEVITVDLTALGANTLSFTSGEGFLKEIVFE
ncbi:MAG: hypothetical protein AAGA02_02310 [Bacteroidota bacterium]